MANTTQILISFGMADHGANFVVWLQNVLKKKYDLYSDESVYVDFMNARLGKTVHHGIKLLPQPEGDANPFWQSFKIRKLSLFTKTTMNKNTAEISPDIRSKMISSTGAFVIGAQKKNWDGAFKKAMSEASVMIFCYTQAFKDSPWTMKEWGDFHILNMQRMRDGRPLLKGIVLEFGSSFNAIGCNQINVSRIPVSAQITGGGDSDGIGWDTGDFRLSESDLEKLYKRLPPIRAEYKK